MEVDNNDSMVKIIRDRIIYYYSNNIRYEMQDMWCNNKVLYSQ